MTHYNVRVQVTQVEPRTVDDYGKTTKEREVIDRVDSNFRADTLVEAVELGKAILDLLN